MYKTNATLNMVKKSATKTTDWHAADIVAAIKKTGTNLYKMSREHGYASGTLQQAIIRPYPKCERIIAEHLGLTPQSIWPSRYNADGTSKSARGQRKIGRHYTNLISHKRNDTPVENTHNVNALTPIKQGLAA